MQKISTFECLDKSSKPIGSFTIDEALNYIKDNPKKDLISDCKFNPETGGKKNPLIKFKDRLWDSKEREFKFVGRNYYTHVKQKECIVVTWNCFVEEKRMKDKIQAPSGYIYCDVDDFSKLINSGKAANNTEAKDYVKKQLSSNSLKFVKAVWDSFGGDGLGFLVKVTDINLNNFTSTWKALNEMFLQWNIVIDPQTKDITRCNVLPYDTTIFIRDEQNIIPFDAVEPKTEKFITIETSGIPLEIVSDVLKYELNSLYRKDSSWSNNHISYKFYFDYFVFCNQMGIDLDDALNYLIENVNNYPALFKHRDIHAVNSEIVSNIKKYYANQFGLRKIASKDNDYTIYSIYKQYSSDIDLKLEYTWNNIKGKLYEKNKKISMFVKTAKEHGILKKPVLKFLEAILDFDDSLYKIVDKIYGDSNILFGVVKVINEEGLKSKKESFIKWANENSMKVLEMGTFSGDLNKTLNKLVDEANNIFQSISNENIYHYFNYYYKNSKSYAISKEDSLNHFLDIISDENFNDIIRINNKISTFEKKNFIQKLKSVCEFVSNEIYLNDTWKFGLRTIKVLTPEKIRSRFNITEEYFLENGHYINELNIPDRDNQVIWGNTGQGKTTWICEHTKGKRLILVPIIPLLMNIDNDYNASVFYRDKKNVHEGDELIVCTYSSFPNLLKQMKKWENCKVSDYALYIDEEHNNAVSSNPEFRGFELNFIVDNMHLFKSRRLLTGTKFPVLHPAFNDFEIVRVNWKQTPVKSCTPVKYTNILYAIEQNLSKKGKNLIYLQNKKEEGQMGALMDYLVMKGWNKKKIWCINADEKNSENFNKLMRNQAVDDDVQIVICTSVIVEGVNIKNDDFKTVHFMTSESSINMEQMVNRLRSIYTKSMNSDSMIYIYNPIDAVREKDTDHVDVIEVQKKLIETAERGLELFSKAYITGDSLSYKSGIKVFNQQLFGKSGLYRNNNGVWEIDYLSIANMAYKEEKIYANKNIEFMQILLHEYNWQFKDEIIISEEINSAELETIKKLKAERKEGLQQDVLQILEQIRNEGEIECCNKVEDDVVFELEKLPRPTYQVNLRAKVKYLCNNMEFDSACDLVEEWINDHKMSDRIWNKITRQITIQLTGQLKSFDKAKDNTSEFAKELIAKFKTLKKDKKHLSLDVKSIKDLVNNIKIKLKDSLCGEEESVKVIKQFFDVEEILEDDGIHYQINGIKIINEVASFTWKLQKWANELYENGKAITNEELANRLNKFRSDLPILSMYKLDSRNSMRLIHDYYEFERVGSKKVKNKNVNTYAITNLSPKEISKYEIIPLRKVDLANKHLEDMTDEERKVCLMEDSMNNLNYQVCMKNDEYALPF